MNCTRIKLLAPWRRSLPLNRLCLFHSCPAGLKNCMRIKLDMSAANKALRDPVAFRCNLTHHWRTEHTYKVGSSQWARQHAVDEQLVWS